jgi:predicted CoA-binding protein
MTYADTEELLRTYDTIVVVGASIHPEKAAHSIPALMQRYGWRIIPVNPHAEKIFGERAYRRLADVPDSPIGLVNVFRPSPDTPDIARQAVAVGARALWLQLGIFSVEARRIADDAGLAYVEDRCLAVERARYALRGPSHC